MISNIFCMIVIYYANKKTYSWDSFWKDIIIKDEIISVEANPACYPFMEIYVL